jgi:hypothetical protein
MRLACRDLTIFLPILPATDVRIIPGGLMQLMKKSKTWVLFLIGVVLSIDACAPVAVVGPPPRAGIVVAVEDRPYYVRGPYYVAHGRRWVWVSGHWAWRHYRRVWVHGHYVLG